MPGKKKQTWRKVPKALYTMHIGSFSASFKISIANGDLAALHI